MLHQLKNNTNCASFHGFCDVDSVFSAGHPEVRKGIYSLDSSLGQKERGVITVFIVGVQIILVFMYKFYFFDLL